MKKTLLVIIPDKLSVLIQKGEVVPRYYNPGNLFDEVHIMMTNDDTPDPSLVQPMVGNAKLILHNFAPPPHFFRNTLGWQRFLMRRWLKDAFKLISTIHPDIMRCYGGHLNLIIGEFVKKRGGIPLIVSLHTHPYLDTYKEKLSLKNKVQKFFSIRLLRCISNADMILPVYKEIGNFLSQMGIYNYKILYNTVGVLSRDQKKNWELKGAFRCICVGQQIANKNPENLIQAVASMEGVVLDIVGYGYLNSYLKALVLNLSAEHKIKFIDALPHTELCRRLKNYDCFATMIDCVGISKTVMEAFLAKLPVLMNYNSHHQVPELSDSICFRVKNTPLGYKKGLKKMMSSLKKREDLVERAYQVASREWDPRLTEQKHMKVYEDILIHA